MRFEKKVRVSAPPERVWEVAGDPARIGTLSSRLEIEPMSEPAEPASLGSRYRSALHVGPSPLGAIIEVVALREARDLAWVTLTGIDHRFRIMVRDDGAGGSWLTLRFAYDSPGMLGALADVAAFLPVRAVMLDLLDRVVREAGRS
ncbi:MAG: SRPBCC family protein [Aeromicrobium sp.]|uniref:SRPBCC family protein n=1 Tax=Aeromicrobium sp. TaxID=1871063 RepID=UPI0039E7137C